MATKWKLFNLKHAKWDTVPTDLDLKEKSDEALQLAKDFTNNEIAKLPVSNPVVFPIPISDVNGLQLELDDKAIKVHTHTIADVTGLQTELDAKATNNHLHTSSDVTDFNTAVETKVNSMNLTVPSASLTVEGKVRLSNDTASIDETVAATSKAVNDALVDAKTTSKSYTDNQIAGLSYAAPTHTHDISEIVNLLSILAGKSEVGHTHTKADFANFTGEVQTVVNSMNIKDNAKTVVFVQNGNVTVGTMNSHIILPFNFKLNEITTYLAKTSSDDLSFSIQSSTDFITWKPVFTNNISLLTGVHYKSDTVNATTILNKGTALRIEVISTIGDGENLSVNLVGEKQ